MQETLVQFLGQEDPWRRDRLPTPVFLVFPGGSAGKESACNAGDLGSIPGLRTSPGKGNGYPVQHSGLENSMDCISPRGPKELNVAERLSLSQWDLKGGGLVESKNKLLPSYFDSLLMFTKKNERIGKKLAP